MRIVELEARHVRIPLRRRSRTPATPAPRPTTSSSAASSPTARVGYGEGVPRDYVTGETIDSALDLLKPQRPAAQLEPCARLRRRRSQLAERLQARPGPRRRPR